MEDPQAEPTGYRLRLFIAGSTPRSRRAIENIKQICAVYLAGRYDLEIVDIYQQPHLASENQVVAAPTLLRIEPSPIRRIVGDLSDQTLVLRGLEIVMEPREDRRGG